jgi:hypothetical protein
MMSEMGEGRRKKAVSRRKRGVLTLGFPPGDDSLVKAMKLYQGLRHSSKQHV